MKATAVPTHKRGVAAEKKVEAGPKGGRILEKTSPKAEFVVEKDHSVTIVFYGADLKPIAVTDQSVAVVAGKAKLEFEKNGDVLVSKTKLPEGDGYNLIFRQLGSFSKGPPENYSRPRKGLQEVP